MTEKKLNENQVWMISMIFIPVLILINIGKELTSDFSIQIMYSGLFGALSGVIGYLTYYLTKEKSRLLKVTGSLILLSLSILITIIVDNGQSDAEIMSQEWHKQQIGHVKFETPTKLNLIEVELPDSFKGYYDELFMYSDDGKDRFTLFLKGKLITDTFSIATAYSNILEGMFSKMNVDLETFDMDVFDSDDEEIYSMFSIDMEGENVLGYGYLFLQGENIESIWLMPKTKGFTREYIEHFDIRIMPTSE